MMIPSQLDKARKDLHDNLSDLTPLYVVVGMADAAAARVRSAGSDLGTRAAGALTVAGTTYSDLAGRGRTLVTRVRGQAATGELEHQAKATVTKAKAATTTTKRAATRAKTSTRAAATTTRRSASTAKTAAKSAATSSRRTAGAARKAAGAAGGKLGT
jgi:hypothetical protein